MTIKEYIGEDNCTKLRERLEEVLNSESGFIYLVDGKIGTDVYKNICGKCVASKVGLLLQSAITEGLVPEHGEEGDE